MAGTEPAAVIHRSSAGGVRRGLRGTFRACPSPTSSSARTARTTAAAPGISSVASWSTTTASAAATHDPRDDALRLVWSLEFERVDEAYALEKQLQGWSRAKRQALIDGRIDDIRALAGRSFAAQDLRAAVKGHAMPDDEEPATG
ncbi:hypothetical protein GCM10027448_24410 [Nocardioides dilutus]